MKDLKDFEEFIKKELLKNKALTSLELSFLLKNQRKTTSFCYSY